VRPSGRKANRSKIKSCFPESRKTVEGQRGGEKVRIGVEPDPRRFDLHQKRKNKRRKKAKQNGGEKISNRNGVTATRAEKTKVGRDSKFLN